ncbi:hypothetical protein F5984_10755 [Rudanella paleaurantiibacter]|uniref:DUF4843 domain-containing protein n=1 Tax=Rudanella paleaurantiibacter TaxID=2614655 RepID=A0A7J5U151_9BACT|nr:hypothetical protein [Rudanella paleaurantiibacter]KAB7731271.1 hypothetical protein F5984_10755 [Rudanella paleaurantiibacter]
MKKLNYILLCALSVLGLAACDNTLDQVFDEQTLVEFNEAILRTNATGRTYSITSLANTPTAGTTSTAQLNLVGRQRGSELTVRVLVDPATTAPASSYTLSNGGNVVIPANSSFGSLTVTVGRASSTTAPVGNLVLVIDSTSTDFKPSQNYKRLGFSFRN